MKEIKDMTRAELLERRSSAKRRMDRYARMDNMALFTIAQQEYNACNILLTSNLVVVNKP